MEPADGHDDRHHHADHYHYGTHHYDDHTDDHNPHDDNLHHESDDINLVLVLDEHIDRAAADVIHGAPDRTGDTRDPGPAGDTRDPGGTRLHRTVGGSRARTRHHGRGTAEDAIQ